VRAFVMLADFAEEINGKLYVMGGGWSRVVMATPNVSMSLTGKVFVPWDQANRRMPLSVRLFDADGHEVGFGDPRQFVRLEGDFEVGRPPGLVPGTEIDAPLSFRFNDLPLTPGRYRWQLTIANEDVADASFDVVVP
jgi:hypothetical protein